MGAPEKIKARYEAGRPSPYHMPPPQSQPADVETSVSGLTLRNWARQLADNSSIAGAVIDARLTNGLCSGLTYEPLVKDKAGKLIPELNDAIRHEHELWSKNVDVTGEYTRQELERMVWQTWDVDGEAFVRRVMMNRGDSNLDYRVQILENDWLPLDGTGLYEGATIIQSVQKDAWGMPVAYHVNPNEYGIGMAGWKNTIRVPAKDMWHLKRTSRPVQTRGVTLFARVIFRIADLGEFQQSHRLAARASADLFMSVNRAIDMEPFPTDSETGETIEPSRSWMFERLQMIDGLAPGETVNFHDPQHPNQNAVDFGREDVRYVASCCRVGFSQIMQVFDSSYAAQRLEVVDTFRKTEMDRSKFVSDFARSSMYEQPLESMIRKGLLPARALKRADKKTLMNVRIDGPQMPVIDPVKDRDAYSQDQEKGWDSRPGIIRKLGRVPSQVDAERDADDAMPEEPVPAAPPKPEEPAVPASDTEEEAS